MSVGGGVSGGVSPSTTLSLHEDTSTFLSRFEEWLTLELDFARTRSETKLVQSNEMIPEIDAREAQVKRGINTIKFNYNLGE